jgi:hypothetical protein
MPGRRGPHRPRQRERPGASERVADERSDTNGRVLPVAEVPSSAGSAPAAHEIQPSEPTPPHVKTDVAKAIEWAHRPDATPSDLVTRLSLPRTGFKRQGSHLQVGQDVIRPRGPLGMIWRVLIGAPIPTWQEQHERLSKIKALAVFSSDALSSVAYAPEAVLLILLAAGSGALSWSWPISLGIVALLAMVATS